jgi:biopolymer transport protein ExbD
MNFMKKKHIKLDTSSVSLNVMPFVDIFSLLTTFLLFTAVFVSIGVHVVQSPFISNAAPTSEEKSTDEERILKITMDMSHDALSLKSEWSLGSAEEKTEKFPRTIDGLKNLRTALSTIKTLSPKTDKVSLFIDNDLTFDDITSVLDLIKLGRIKGEQAMAPELVLFPKVIFASILI